MTLKEQIERLNRLADYVENELPLFAKQVAANDLAALVTLRVTETGKSYTGAGFTPYSTNEVAAWRFWGKSRTQTAENKVRKLSREQGALSYKNFRGINNLNTNKKNFLFTGEMWRKFGIVKFTTGGGKFFISLGGTTPAAQTKIDDNSEREGISVIEANEAERNMVQVAVQDWLNINANRILNE